MIEVGFIKPVADLQYILFVFTRFEISRQYGPIRTDGEVEWRLISEHHVLRVSDLIRPLTINPPNKLEIYKSTFKGKSYSCSLEKAMSSISFL